MYDSLTIFKENITMADKNLLAQMLENLVNDDQAKAEELFHEYVVSKSREIYEDLIESELQDEEVDEATDEEDEDKVDEASEEDSDDEEVKESSDEEDDEMEEGFEDVAIEADDDMGDMGADPTDDLAGELDSEDGEDLSGESEGELFQDLDAIVDELQARFDALGGDHAEPDADNMGGPSDMDADNEGFELATVREYVEKVPAGHGAEKKGAGEGAMAGTGAQTNKEGGHNTKSVVAGKNDMGGTTANILSSKEDAATYANQGQLKGNGLAKGNVVPNPDAKGNINVPGGKAGNAFTTKQPGHGAEKAGSKETADNKQSLFRGRR
jgi:hypothetical protein